MGLSTKIVYPCESGRISCVPKQSGKMNQRERAICARVKEFREAIKWSQREFAAQVGTTLNQLASIEYRRTPLPYLIAWRMREQFGVSLSSLAEEGFPVDANDLDPWPEPSTMRNRALLTDVLSKLDNRELDARIAGDVFDAAQMPPHLPPPEYKHRAVWLKMIEGHLKQAIASVPDGSVIKFGNQIIKAIQENLEKYPKDSESNIALRLHDLGWELIRTEIARRLLRKAAENSSLTEAESIAKLSEVKPPFQKMLAEIRLATNAPGQMSALADYLGRKTGKNVPLASVSRWLSGKREPGGEITLWMREWVTDPKRQK